MNVLLTYYLLENLLFSQIIVLAGVVFWLATETGWFNGEATDGKLSVYLLCWTGEADLEQKVASEVLWCSILQDGGYTGPTLGKSSAFFSFSTITFISTQENLTKVRSWTCFLVVVDSWVVSTEAKVLEGLILWSFRRYQNLSRKKWSLDNYSN